MSHFENTRVKAILKKAVDCIEKKVTYKGTVKQTTGFTELDNYLEGIVDGEVMVIASRPGMGKSSLLMNICLNTLLLSKKPRSVIVSSGLTNTTQYMMHMMANVGRIKRQDIQEGELTDDHWQKLSMSTQKLINCDIYINDLIRNFIHLKSMIEFVHKETGVAPIVIIDDIYHIRHIKPGPKKKFDSDLPVVDVVFELKRIALEKNLPVIFTTQVSRDVEERFNNRPEIFDIENMERYEDCIDKALLVYRDEMYNPAAPNGVTEIIIAKNSRGERGTVFLEFEGQYGKFNNPAKSAGSQNSQD